MLLQPSLRACRPTYSELVPKPGGLRQEWHLAENILGCITGLTLALICVAAAGLLVVGNTVRGVSESESRPAINQGLIKSRIWQVSADSCFHVL